MSNKRPYSIENTSTTHAASPAFSPVFSHPETPASAGYSPRPSGQLSLGGRRRSRAAKRRKSSNVKGVRDDDQQREESTGPGLAGPSDQRDEDLDQELEEDENRKELNDDDYTVRKREDLLNKDKLKVLLEHFDAQQMDRYGEYRNSGLAKAAVRKLANSVLQQSVSDRVTIVTRGLAKVFVGHMVEQALEVQRRRGGSGPLTQYDLKEAYRAHLAERDRGGSDRRKMFTR